MYGIKYNGKWVVFDSTEEAERFRERVYDLGLIGSVETLKIEPYDDGKSIYLIWDKKLEIIEGATTNRNEADEKVAQLNRIISRGVDRYKVTKIKDFAK